MKIVYSNRFRRESKKIVDFIKADSLNRGKKFLNDLKTKIEFASTSPLSCRKKLDQNNENLRELIFKGYTIPFLIDFEKNQILILGIFNQNNWEQ